MQYMRLGLLLWMGALLSPVPAEAVEIEVFSPQGTVKGVRQVAVRFSGQMVRFGDPRIPEPFSIDCPEAGKGRWADARNWVYDFGRDLPAGVRCSFTLKEGVTSIAGKPISGTKTFSFDTGGPAVVATLPAEGDTAIDEEQTFLLALDAEVDPESVTAHAYCEVQGIGERIEVEVLEGEARRAVLDQRRLLGYAYYRLLWKSRSQAEGRVDDAIREQLEAGIVVLRCRRGLPPEAEVRLVWGPGIATRSGIVTGPTQTLSFKTRPAFTARFECQRVNPQAGCLPVADMGLRFSAPVVAALAVQVRLRREDGGLIAPKPIDAAKTPSLDEVVFEGPFPEETRFRVELPAELRDDAGRLLQNAARFPLEVATDAAPPLAKFAGEFGILEHKEGGVLPVTLRNLEPAIAARRAPLATGEMHGDLKRWVEDDATIAHWIRHVTRAMQRRGRWRRSEGEKRVWLEQTGDASVFGPNLDTTAFTVPKAAGARELEVVGIPLQDPGFYVVEIASPKLGAALLGREATRYVATAALVTNLAVHLKWGREGSLVWVTALDNAEPVADAELRVSDYCSGLTLWQGRTRADGIARIEGAALPKPHGYADCSSWHPAPLFVSARKDGDLSFVVSGWNRGLQPYEFELPVGWEEQATVAHSVLDRSLFRAGETVSMKHYLRRRTLAGFAVPDSERPDKLKISHEGSGQQYDLPLSLDAQGIGESLWPIPEDAKLGVYRIALVQPGSQRWLEAGSFRVEQFRVPIMRAVIQPPAEPLVNSPEVSLDLYVSYLSGGGASEWPVKLRSRVLPKSLSFQDYPEFQFGGPDVREGIQTEARDYNDYFGEGGRQWPAQLLPLTLDEAGAARARIPDLPKVETPHELNLELEYRDPNGESLTVANRIPLWPAKVHLGIRADRWVAVRGTLGFQVLALDLDGKPIADQPVRVELFERRTYSHRRRLVGGFYAYENKTEVRRIEGGCDGETDREGRLSCAIEPEVAGQIVLRASSADALGNRALATREVWVAGREDWWFGGGQGDRMDVLPESKEYEPGEQARLQVRMPFREATALVTVEREGVIDAFVTRLYGTAPVVELPIADRHSPNAYVSVLAVRGRVGGVQGWLADTAKTLELPWDGDGGAATALVDLGKPSFRLGIAPLRIGWTPHRLEVRLRPDAEVHRVRERAKVGIEVRGANGAPPPPGAELAVAAVDEGLLELMPNASWGLLDRMMGSRGIEVYTATAQMQVVGKRHYGRKAVPPGGGGGRQSGRELFDTLLLWRGRVSLDESGRAEVEVPLNDALTTFRIVAVASAGAGLFGTGSTSIRTTRDLMLHSGLPPVVREGDRYRGVYTLRNASSRRIAGEATALVSAVPGGEAAGTLAAQPFELEPGRARELVWEQTAPVGTTELIWEVSAGEGAESDRIRSRQAVVPVHPVRVYQSTLARLEAPLQLTSAQPEDAIAGRGGLRVGLRARLGEGLTGVRDYMERYRYTCLEQRVSKAVALRDRSLWETVMSGLASHLDSDGLLKYFATDALAGSEVLTAYVLAIAHETDWPIPDPALTRAKQGLKGFIEGRIAREGELATADLALRKLAAIEALSRYGEARAAMLDSIAIDPKLWPTSGLLDWINILKRLGDMEGRGARLSEADRILRSRLNFQGTTMGFSTEHSDALWWLMVSTDLNAVRALLAVLETPAWRADLPRMVRGALARLQSGHWNTTPANAFGVLAMEKFSAAFESQPVTGETVVSLGDARKAFDWTAGTGAGSFDLGWPQGAAELQIVHRGKGRPWASVESRAALPLEEPIASGFAIEREVKAIEQKTPRSWSREDVGRVTLRLEAQSDMSWVVVDDPIPAGASILGTGLGRDARLLTLGEEREGRVWPAFEERRQDAFRAYYRFVPKGSWTVEYTLRYNTAGRFELPPTRVEALYAPEMFAERPNASVEVEDPP